MTDEKEKIKINIEKPEDKWKFIAWRVCTECNKPMHSIYRLFEDKEGNRIHYQHETCDVALR